MKNIVYKNTFISDMTREGYGFSYEGAELLFDYIEQLEDDLGSDIDYDPIAFRCEYSEYCIGDYINNYFDISEDFIGWLLDREQITEEESEELKKDNYKKLDANSYDYYTLEGFFEERLQNMDDNIIASKDYGTFIILDY